MQHANTENEITGKGYNFWGTHFFFGGGGAGFWAVNLRGAKFLGPRF